MWIRTIITLSLLLFSYSGYAQESTAPKAKNPLFKSIKYNFELAFENLNFLVNRSEHEINDQETIEGDFKLTLDNEKNVKILLDPRFRYDFNDSSRNRYIPNDAYALFYSPHFETYGGLRIMTWGVSNFYNPTDMLNRKDYQDNFYIPDKLGELMVGGKFLFAQAGPLSNLAFEAIHLPLFQETPLPNNNTRFSMSGSQLGIPFTKTDFQDVSDRYIDNLGLALKTSATIGAFDGGLYLYHGPDHDPTFYLRINENGSIGLTSYYYDVNMIGFNGSASVWNFVFHLETALKLTNTNDPKYNEVFIVGGDVIPDNYFQFIPAIEYMFSNFLGKGDLNLALEYLGENKHSNELQELRPFKNDVFLGAKWNLNNHLLTELQLGAVKDLTNKELVALLDGSTRIYKGLRLGVQATYVIKDDENGSVLSFFDNNTFVSARLSYNFGGKLK